MRDAMVSLASPSRRVSLQPRSILDPCGTSSHIRAHRREAFVMAGLVAAIHVFVVCQEDVDARHKAGTYVGRTSNEDVGAQHLVQRAEGDVGRRRAEVAV